MECTTPTRTRRHVRPPCRLVSLSPRWPSRAQQLPRNHEPLDLARPLADFAQLRVAEHPLDRVVLDVSVAPVDLDRLRGHPHRRLAREQLPHRGLLLERQALILPPRRAVHEQPRRLDLHRHVRELPLDRLEVRDRLPELVPLLRILHRLFERPLRDPDAEGADADAAAVERFLSDHVTFTLPSHFFLLSL